MKRSLTFILFLVLFSHCRREKKALSSVDADKQSINNAKVIEFYYLGGGHGEISSSTCNGKGGLAAFLTLLQRDDLENSLVLTGGDTLRGPGKKFTPENFDQILQLLGKFGVDYFFWGKMEKKTQFSLGAKGRFYPVIIGRHRDKSSTLITRGKVTLGVINLNFVLKDYVQFYQMEAAKLVNLGADILVVYFSGKFKEAKFLLSQLTSPSPAIFLLSSPRNNGYLYRQLGKVHLFRSKGNFNSLLKFKLVIKKPLAEFGYQNHHHNLQKEKLRQLKGLANLRKLLKKKLSDGRRKRFARRLNLARKKLKELNLRIKQTKELSNNGNLISTSLISLSGLQSDKIMELLIKKGLVKKICPH